MAERRMLEKTIIEGDKFLDLPLPAQALYFHLNMNADKKGNVYCPRAIARYIGADEELVQLLTDKGFITKREDTGIAITHWKEHNGIGENANKRLTYSYRQWRKKVLERDHYTCQSCGSCDDLHVHHKKSFAKYPDERENVDNGITLCETCHRKIHGLVKRKK